MDFDEYYRERHPSDFDDPEHWWHPRNPIWVVHRHQIERAVLDALAVMPTPPEELEVLEVGCGSGRHLRFLSELGVPPSKLHGIDLLASRLDIARTVNPSIDLRLVDAAEGIPFADVSFDLVTQFVAFSSILDHGARRRVAADMLRVLRPGGWVLSYDVVSPRPGHIPDGLTESDVAALFPGVEWVFRQPLHSRVLAHLACHPVAAAVAEALPVIRKSNVVLLGQRR